MSREAQRAAIEVAAVICCAGDRLLVQLRQSGAHAGGTWEFPGGKLRPGETPEQAARRELEEEVACRASGLQLLHTEDHAYPERTVRLYFFWCTGFDGVPRGCEGQSLRWVTVAELNRLPTPAGNQRVVELLREHLMWTTASGSSS